MTKVVFSIENYSSKITAQIWQYIENHVLAGASELKLTILDDWDMSNGFMTTWVTP